MFARSPMLAFPGAAGGGGAIRPQDVIAILTQPANQMQAAISALPFSPDILVDKDRAASESWSWRDSLRGFDRTLASNSLGVEAAWPGYSGSNNRVVLALKQQLKLAVRLTYMGDGGSNRQVQHALGIKPGKMIVKQLDGGSNDWAVYHRSVGASGRLYLNTTEVFSASPTAWNNTEPTDQDFTVGSLSRVNASGRQYVAYLIAHDPSATGFVQCFAVTADSNGAATYSTGWANGAQCVELKASSTTGDWEVFDTKRGLGQRLRHNLPDPEDSVSRVTQSAGTLSFTGVVANATYVGTVYRAPIT